MHHGWVVQTDKGLIQHARSVLTTDPNAERAMLELVGDPMRPVHRMVGKQPVAGDQVEPPKLMDETKRDGPDSVSAEGRNEVMVKEYNMNLASIKVMSMYSEWKRWRTLT